MGNSEKETVILACLDKVTTRGFSIEEIHAETRLNRTTVSKYLGILEERKQVIGERVAQAKLFRLNHPNGKSR